MAFMPLPGFSASRRGRGLGAFGHVGIGQQPLPFLRSPMCVQGGAGGAAKLEGSSYTTLRYMGKSLFWGSDNKSCSFIGTECRDGR